MPSHRLFLTTLLVLSCDTTTSPKLRVYTVGDETLSHVALNTGLSVARLRALNHLQSEAINWGTGLLVTETDKTLSLPAWKPPLPAPDWKPCAQVEWVPSVRTTNLDQRCTCAGEACLCLQLDDEDPTITFGQASWKSAAFPLNGSNAFRHARVDLDGDDQPESVVSVRESVSNGLGVEWWRHMVVQRGLPVASFVTVDYGESFVAQPQGCALLATAHDWRADQLRGDGSYWLARLHVLKDGAMRAIGPEVVRRYTFRFADQRGRSMNEDVPSPLPWFTDVGAFIWPEAETRMSCRAASVVFEDDEARFDLGGLGVFHPRDLYRDEPLPNGAFEYDELLDAATGAPLLAEYRVFGEARWSGHQVSVCEGVLNGAPHTTLAFH